MTKTADRLAIEFITALGLDPVDYVHLAADLGVARVGMSLSPIVMVPEGAPVWSMREDRGLHARVKGALAERGVQVLVGEAFLLHPQMDVVNSATDLDLFAELGAKCANVVGADPDEARSHDQFAKFCEMAAQREMRACIEFMPGVAIDTLDKALAHAEASGNPQAGVLLDSMHVFATVTSLDAIAALPRNRVVHAQLCDTFAASDVPYFERAKFERLTPGEGDLPLADFVRALPDDVPLGLEIPQRANALAGSGHRERIGAILETTRNFTTDLL